MMIKIMFVLMTTSLWMIQADAKGDVLPTRSECIVKIVFDSTKDGTLTDDDSNIISEFVYSGLYNSRQIKIAASQRTVRNSQSSISVFIQYIESCELRVKLAEEVINNATFTKHIIVGYGVSREIIKPGIDTIDTKNPNIWRD